MALFARLEEMYQDTQDITDILLDAEVKLGEMLEKLEPNIESSGRGTIEKKRSLPEGITKKQSHEAQEIAGHDGN